MEHRKISSRDNPRLKHLRKLLTERSYRYSSRQYVVEGLRALEGACRAAALFVAHGTPLPPLPADEVYIVDRDVFHRMAATENSQGVLAVLPLNVMDVGAVDRSARYVLLDRLQDPGNMGSIIRAAVAFGIKGIMVTAGSVDPFAPKVARAAAGALAQLDIIAVERMEQLQGYTVIAADADGEELSRVAWPRHFILAVGNEAKGLSDEIRSLASKTVAIPMPGSMESLNAAVAAGIILYCATHPT